MTVLTLRFATTNAPESYKHGLLRDKVKRSRRVYRFYKTQRIDVAAQQEAGTFSEGTDRESRQYKALWAQFNDFVKGRRIGNGGVVNRWKFKSRLLEDITVGTGDDAIHIAVIEVTHRKTGFRWKHRVIHKPTKRATNNDLRPVVDVRLNEEHKRDDAANTPWVDAGDFNGPYNLGGVVLGDNGPDHIRASHHFRPAGQEVYDRPNLSDHHFLIAECTVEL